MAMWITATSLLVSFVALGSFRESAPTWLQLVAELIAVTSLFVCVCLLESGGSSNDHSNHAA